MCNTFSQTIFWWEFFFYQHVVEPACPKGVGGERERERKLEKEGGEKENLQMQNVRSLGEVAQ